MGYRISYVMFDGAPDVMMRTLGLVQTGTKNEVPDGSWWVARLKKGRSVLWSEDEGYVFRSSKDLARLSMLGGTISCQVNETVMCAQAVGYAAGEEAWNILWIGDQGFQPTNMKLAGHLPESVEARVAAAKSLQEKDNTVDYMFDVPVQVAEELSGFRYDTYLEADFVDEFKLVSPRVSAFRPGNLSRFLGVRK